MPERLKVVHIVTRLDYGGAQQNTLYTVAQLDRKHFEPVLICGEGGYLDPQARALEQDGLRLRFLPDLVRPVHPLRDLIALLQLHRMLVEESPHAVHTHSSKAGILGRLAAWMAGVPVILHTFHGFGFHERMRPAVRVLLAAVERLAARVCTRLIFVSNENMDYARRYRLGSPESYVLIRSGVRLKELPFRLRDRGGKKASLGCPPDAPLVLGVGNLKPQKNAGDFVRTAAAIVRRVPEARFIFVGDGPQRAALLEAAAQAGLGDRLAFVGWRRDVPELLAAADVFLLTSLWEGLPRSLVEAMGSGLPCACYAVDGVRDLIRDGENAFSAPAGDWESLAARVTDLLSDPGLRRKVGNAAKGSVGEEFDIDVMVRRQETLLKELCLHEAS